MSVCVENECGARVGCRWMDLEIHQKQVESPFDISFFGSNSLSSFANEDGVLPGT